MELPKFERQPLRPDKEATTDNEIWFPDWNCFCCHDQGRIPPILVERLIPGYDYGRDKAVACQRCDAGAWMTGEEYDQRFNRLICNQLAEIERANWIETVKGQQRTFDLDRLAKSMAMSGTHDRTANDEREIQIRRAEIEAAANEEVKQGDSAMSRLYKYEGFWIETFLDEDDGSDNLTYFASIDMGDEVLNTEFYPSREEAEVAAEKFIDEQSNGGLETCTKN